MAAPRSGPSTGSPPHMRGKADRKQRRSRSRGITPAHAGKRSWQSLRTKPARDHPRTCGEKAPRQRLHFAMLGSPPHMRGKVWSRARRKRPRGITPAHAGKRQAGYTCFEGQGDHPRTCGEKSCCGFHTASISGSPPHMRGKVLLDAPFFQQFGITPAHAGKRLKRSRSTVPHAAIVPLFPSVCNKPAGSDGSPAGHDAPPFLPIENAAPASPAYNLRSL